MHNQHPCSNPTSFVSGPHHSGKIQPSQSWQRCKSNPAGNWECMLVNSGLVIALSQAAWQPQRHLQGTCPAGSGCSNSSGACDITQRHVAALTPGQACSPAHVTTMASATAKASRCCCRPYDAGTTKAPSPVATLSHAVFMLVGRKNSRYSRPLERGPCCSLSLQSVCEHQQQGLPKVCPHAALTMSVCVASCALQHMHQRPEQRVASASSSCQKCVSETS